MISRKICFRLSESFPFAPEEGKTCPLTHSSRILNNFYEFTKTIKEPAIIENLLFIWTDFNFSGPEDILIDLANIPELSIPSILIIRDFMLERLKGSFFKSLFSNCLKSPYDVILVILTDYSDEKNSLKMEKLFSSASSVYPHIHLALSYNKGEEITHKALWSDTLNKNNLFIYLWTEKENLFTEKNILFLPQKFQKEI